jgi:hypothetical protein
MSHLGAQPRPVLETTEEAIMVRWVCWFLVVLFGLNGVVMLLQPYPWFMAVPGVIETGPFNDHFVRDIGATYLACAVGMAFGARDLARHAGAAAVVATFQTVHAMIHVITPFCGDSVPWPLLARDFPGVFLPTLLTIWIAVVALRNKGA